MAYTDPQYQKGYQAGYVAGKRAMYLADKGCAKCGAVDGLELDHVDPGQKLDHRVWSWSLPRMLAELSKCQVLCRTCHAEKTLADNPTELAPHGTLRRYKSKKYPCRCSECRAASWEYEKTRRGRAA